MDRRRSWISVSLLLILTGAIYIRPSIVFGNKTLVGADYFQLHIRHITFARDALFGPRHFLPAWYPRELFGAPFSANLQTFPWIPTRLLLFLFDPIVAYAAAVPLAALLAALFTYLYCRRVGLSEVGALIAGWTFACAGFFASRVMAGHLPLLEAYPALPLLLWLADRAIAPDGVKKLDFVALAIATACIALAGHPQLPIYSIAAAALYVIVRGRGGLRWKALCAMSLGVGLTMAAWWPMLLLVQRSSRVLQLGPASNDIAMPYGRLLALVLPGADGWPDVLSKGEKNPFHGYPHDGYFWDTASYLGLLPLLVILLLLGWIVAKKRLPGWPWPFLAALGAGALLLALPLADPLRELIPGTFLRSPARLLYLTTFAASALLGFGVDAFWNSRLRFRQSLVILCLAGHFLDLSGFARLFTQPVPRADEESAEFRKILVSEVKDARIASDDLAYRDRYDDVGIFDSILLANPYRAFVGLAGKPRDWNDQRLDGSELGLSALQAAGVKIVIGSNERNDLQLLSSSDDDDYLYRVPDPAPRASFFPADKIDFLSTQTILDKFVANPRRDRLLLPLEARAHLSTISASGTVTYSRPSSDEIRLETSVGSAGFIHVIESDDPGWTATVDGASTPIELANGFTMAVAVAQGTHAVILRYQTPGRRLGWMLSLLSSALLIRLIRLVR
ncbi:MAG TPA: YfhO family protein [Bryobacteraceae bacterium]|nr:YfhO family protein [Bryobacteraceae bacterium]